MYCQRGGMVAKSRGIVKKRMVDSLSQKNNTKINELLMRSL
jgi:hypothetical protein